MPIIHSYNESPIGNFKRTLESIVGFVTAIALANSINGFANIHKSINQGGNIDLLTFISFIFLLWLMFRFYFGNIEHLQSPEVDKPYEVVIDGLVIFFQALLLAYMSSFVDQPKLILLFFIILLLTDVVWLIMRRIISLHPNIEFDIGNEIIHNQYKALIITLIFLLGAFIGIESSSVSINNIFMGRFEINSIWAIFLMIGDTISDLYINSRRYFVGF